MIGMKMLQTFAAVNLLSNKTYVVKVKRAMMIGVVAQKNTQKASKYFLP